MSEDSKEQSIELAKQLSEVLSVKRKQLSASSLEAFVSLYLTKIATHTIPAFHKEMMQLLEGLSISKSENFSSKKNKSRLLFIAPRGFAKSSICSVAFPLWLAVTGRKKDIILVSATIGLAKEMLRKIRTELEANEFLIKDYGAQKSDKWTEDYLVLANGCRILAKGRGFQIRGFRPDMIISDDLEDEEVIYSKEQRDKLENWFFRTLLPTLKPEQDLIYIGTMLHESSLMAKLRVKEEFEVRFYQALTNGKSIWEELWPTETLNKLRREMGEYAFLAEYQNTPISLKEQPIKPHFLEGVEIKGTVDFLCLAIDPAISEKDSADDRAFVLLGRIVNERKEIVGFKEIYSEAGKWPVTEQIERIISIYERYTKVFDKVPFRLVIETIAFQKVFKDDLLRAARVKNIYLPISEAELGVGDNKRPRDKMTRLMQIVHLFEQRLVQVVNPDLHQQLLGFPLGDHDDMVDACVYSLYYLMKYRQGGFYKSVEEKKLVDTKPSYYVNEVRPGVFATESQPKKLKPRGFIRLHL